MSAEDNLRSPRPILSRRGKNGSWTPRKATRGGVLWTPRESGESKGGTRVAARAVRRGLERRIPLTLNRTSDRDLTPLLHAARGNRKQPEQNPVIASPSFSDVFAVTDLRNAPPYLSFVLPKERQRRDAKLVL